jgi:hypothetical protein
VGKLYEVGDTIAPIIHEGDGLCRTAEAELGRFNSYSLVQATQHRDLELRCSSNTFPDAIIYLSGTLLRTYQFLRASRNMAAGTTLLPVRTIDFEVALDVLKSPGFSVCDRARYQVRLRLGSLSCQSRSARSPRPQPRHWLDLGSLLGACKRTDFVTAMLDSKPPPDVVQRYRKDGSC